MAGETTELTRTKGAAPAALGAGGSLKPVFGLVFEINGTEVPITSDTLAEAATKGVEFTLPQPLSLGSIGDYAKFLDDTFGVKLPELPGVLNDVVDVLKDVHIGVDRFHLKVPAKGSEDGVQFTVDISAMLGTPISLIPNSDVLKIKGAVIGATNEAKADG